MKLSANHPLDVIELAWAESRRSCTFGLRQMMMVSGRPKAEWKAALDSGEAAWPPNEVIDERFALVRRGVREGWAIDRMATACRAPREWCAEASRRAFQRDVVEWAAPLLTGTRR